MRAYVWFREVSIGFVYGAYVSFTRGLPKQGDPNIAPEVVGSLV